MGYGVIEGGNGGRLQTTERPSCVPDHISTDDSVTTCVVDRGVRFHGGFADGRAARFSRAPFRGALAGSFARARSANLSSAKRSSNDDDRAAGGSARGKRSYLACRVSSVHLTHTPG